MKNSVELTKKWIADFVIRHSLCPFANLPFVNDKILYKAIDNHKLEQVLIQLHATMLDLEGYSNGFLILPMMSFEGYLDLFYAAEQYIIDAGFDDVYQLASFHPEYQFASYSKADKRNRTNQSPFPMIHILRVDEMKAAIESFGDTAQVFLANEKKMRELD